MIHFIENDYLKIGVKETGAELTSVYSKEKDFEYLWQGNPDIWIGQSPVLFPIIGRLIDDKYILDGKEYDMPKHGFARRKEWEFVGSDKKSITFRLSDDESTREIYPFGFEFLITFSVENSVLSVKHVIKNTGSGTMYFSLGAHPAFNCSIGDKLVFSEKETLEAFKIDLQKSLVLPETAPVMNNETDLVITKDVFNEDALIFKDVKSDFVTLQSENHSVKFTLNNAPYLGIWAKPGAPYVCIEPWWGLNDIKDKKVDFSEKVGINKLTSGESFEYIWSAEMK